MLQTEVSPKLYDYVYSLVQQNQFQEILNVLDTSEVTSATRHHRFRGLALHKLGYYQQGHEEIGHSIAAAKLENQSQLLGVAYLEQGAMLMRERQFDEGFNLYQQGLALIHEKKFLVSALFHLAWAELQLLYTAEAARDIYQGLDLMNKSRVPEIKSYMMQFRYAQIAVYRVQGAHELAIQQAQQAARVAIENKSKILAYQALSHTHRLQGQYAQALKAQESECQYALEGTAAEEARLSMLLLKFTQNQATAAELKQQLAKVSSTLSCRAQLHLAQFDLRQGRQLKALAQLKEILPKEPFIVLDEAPLLVELYQFGRQHSLNLPFPAATRPTHLHLMVRGRLKMYLNDHELPIKDEVAIGLLLYLQKEGPATRQKLTLMLLANTLSLSKHQAKNGDNAVRRVVKAINDCVGYSCVQLDGKYLKLASDLQMTHNLNDRSVGELLAPLYGNWVEQLRRAQPDFR